MTVGMDSPRAPCSVGLVSCLPSPLQTGPLWDIGTACAEKGRLIPHSQGRKGVHALGEPCLTFEPVVGVALALTILIWKS